MAIYKNINCLRCKKNTPSRSSTQKYCTPCGARAKRERLLMHSTNRKFLPLTNRVCNKCKGPIENLTPIKYTCDSCRRAMDHNAGATTSGIEFKLCILCGANTNSKAHARKYCTDCKMLMEKEQSDAMLAKVKKARNRKIDCIDAPILNPQGYGIIHRGGHTIMQHRYEYAKAYNIPIEELHGKDVHHTCHNNACINPKHLTLDHQCDRPYSLETMLKIIEAGIGDTISNNDLLNKGMTEKEIKALRKKYPDSLFPIGSNHPMGCTTSFYNANYNTKTGECYGF